MKRILITLAICLLSICGGMAQLENAQWITAGQQGGTAMPMFRKEFDIRRTGEKVTLHATALGIYDVRVNGKAVTEHELKPGWTDYRKEVTFHTIDITPAVRKGRNDITIQLSNGWWAWAAGRRQGYNSENATLATFLPITDYIIMKLLSQSRSVEVIKPQYLREKIRLIYEEAIKRNSYSQTELICEKVEYPGDVLADDVARGGVDAVGHQRGHALLKADIAVFGWSRRWFA